jgi:hypothetical protein
MKVMKTISISIIIGLIAFLVSTEVSIAQCNDQLLSVCALDNGGATYIKDFKVRLKKGKKNQPAPVAKYQVALSKNTNYRFNACNATEFPGEAIIQLYDSDQLIGSTYNMTTGKNYKGFDFYCKKSGVYNVFISFKEGEEGCAVGILSFVGKDY